MSELRNIRIVDLVDTTGAGIHGESRTTLLKRLKDDEPPFDGLITYRIDPDTGALMVNDHDIGLIPPEFKYRLPFMSVKEKPIVMEKYGENDAMFYHAAIQLIETYPSEAELKKVKSSEKYYRAASKLEDFGDKAQRAGDSMQKAGKGVSSFVGSLFMIALIAFLYFACKAGLGN